MEANSINLDEILEYLRKNVQDCIYMYIDIKKYELNNSEITVWIDRDEEDKINLVVMKYHTSLSLYSDVNSWSTEMVCALIDSYKPSSITGKKTIIDRLSNLVSGYKTEFGIVFRLDKFSDFGGNDLIEPASDVDMMEIAKLVTSDDGIGSYYDIEDYAKQLLKRKQSGMGRNYIIRDNGKIIGHIATYAELDGISTTGGLIVDPHYNGKMLGAVLEGYLVRELKEEGMDIYTFVTQKKRYKLLKNLGNTPVGEYGKMIRQEDRHERARVSV